MICIGQVDLIDTCGKLAFNLDFYTESLSLDRLVPYVGSRPFEDDGNVKRSNEDEEEEEEEEGERRPPSSFLQRYRRLNELLCEVVQDYGLVEFQNLNIQDGESVARVLAVVDKCNGYLLGAHDKYEVDSELFSQLFQLAFTPIGSDDHVREIQLRYLDRYEREPQPATPATSTTTLGASVPQPMQPPSTALAPHEPGSSHKQ